MSLYKISEILQKLKGSCLSFTCRCLFCHKASHRQINLCSPCENLLPKLKSCCRLCAQPFSNLQKGTRCLACLMAPPTYELLQALFLYEPPIDRFIYHLKQHAKLSYGYLLGYLMARELQPTIDIDVILPMPIHPMRQRKRGFNQAHEIAKPIASFMRLPLLTKACTKIYDSHSQATFKDATRRRDNVKPYHFKVDKRLMDKKVLIIEDVVTTGSTIRALSQALLDNGVKKVEIWSASRTARS